MPLCRAWPSLRHLGCCSPPHSPHTRGGLPRPHSLQSWLQTATVAPTTRWLREAGGEPHRGLPRVGLFPSSCLALPGCGVCKSPQPQLGPRTHSPGLPALRVRSPAQGLGLRGHVSPNQARLPSPPGHCTSRCQAWRAARTSPGPHHGPPSPHLLLFSPSRPGLGPLLCPALQLTGLFVHAAWL